MEMMLRDCAQAYDLRVLSLRYFNPIGADPLMRTGLQTARPTHLLGKLLSAVDNDEEFLITGTDWPTRDGSGIRDYVHVWDLARAHLAALQRFDEILPVGGHQSYEVINVGSGSGTTVREFVAAFQAVCQRPLRVRETGPRPGDNTGCYARGDRARDALGWEPGFSLTEAIAHSIQWGAIRAQKLADPS
jgi:UDP-glucose 4-epimerase